MAKGLGNGFPKGDNMIAPYLEAVNVSLGTTVGGNQVACVAALAVADVMTKENLMQNALECGKYLREELEKIDQIKEVRGDSRCWRHY